LETSRSLPAVVGAEGAANLVDPELDEVKCESLGNSALVLQGLELSPGLFPVLTLAGEDGSLRGSETATGRESSTR
jgi:hypothetical protein